MQCHRGRSLDAFFDGIFAETPKKLALIGCGCSVATEPVAEISHQWNISHVRSTILYCNAVDVLVYIQRFIDCRKTVTIVYTVELKTNRTSCA